MRSSTMAPPDVAFQEAGGLSWVGRYTGAVTDWLTLSAAYGVSKDAGTFAAGRHVADISSSIAALRRPAAPRRSIGNPFAADQHHRHEAPLLSR